jgi:flagellar protein FlgJ
MSDADLALFRESLPRLVNTPEGNATIASTIRGLIVYEQQQAQIANRVASREITPAEGRAQLMALDNPLQVFQTGTGATQIQGDWQDLGGGVRIRRVE